MTQTIYKYPLDIVDSQTIKMPANAVPLHVAEQSETLTMWAQVNTANEVIDYDIQIFGTGHHLPSEGLGARVGTVLMGDFVWHVYAREL